VSNFKTLVLGVGAQKTGTSWLNEQLVSNYEFSCGLNKEKSILNCCNNGAKMTEEKLQKHLQFICSPNETSVKYLHFDSNTNYLLNDQHNYDMILQIYFRRILQVFDKNPDLNYFVDISPSYSTLNSKQYALIKDQCMKNSMILKVVYIMRDPVDRAISAARMRYKRALKNGKQLAIDDIISNHYYASPDLHDLDKGNYKYVIESLNKSLDAGDFFLQIYEKMFNSDAYSSLSKFLNTKLITPEFGKKTHAGRGPKDISLSLEKLLIDKYMPVYRFISELLGKDYPIEWRKPS